MENVDASHEACFPIGTSVRIADRATLERFMPGAPYLYPLALEQLEWAERIARIEAIGRYQGGVTIYKLQGISGMWYEACLCRVSGRDGA